jgi:LysW-gamma-L-lysine carboxypeptidase
MDELVLLREMLEIYSPSGKEGEIAAYLVTQMRALGFRAYQDAVGNAIGVLGEGEREIVLLGHIDTVEGFIPIRLEDGRLYGRGAVDAKGPLATFILAATRAASSLEGPRIVVVGAVEEEAGSRGARHIVDSFRPDYAIVGEPSGWDAITLAYKGSLLLSYSLSCPAKHHTADGALPLEEAVGFWNRLAAYADEINRGSGRRFETLDLSLQEMNSSGDGFVQRVEMTIGARMPVGFDVATFKEAASAWADGAEVSFRNEEAPFRAGKNNSLVKAFLRTIRARGGRPTFKLKLGTSDMNTVGPVWDCPIVAYGPGDSSLDHTPDEHIHVQEFYQAIEVMADVLASL